MEIESGSRDDRPKLRDALSVCRRRKATLLIAKLDRLARSVAFIANLMDGDTEFVAVDTRDSDQNFVGLQQARNTAMANGTYDLQDIRTTDRNERTGNVRCEAVLLFSVARWGEVHESIKYKVERTSDGRTYVTISRDSLTGFPIPSALPE